MEPAAGKAKARCRQSRRNPAAGLCSPVAECAEARSSRIRGLWRQPLRTRGSAYVPRAAACARERRPDASDRQTRPEPEGRRGSPLCKAAQCGILAPDRSLVVCALLKPWFAVSRETTQPGGGFGHQLVLVVGGRGKTDPAWTERRSLPEGAASRWPRRMTQLCLGDRPGWPRTSPRSTAPTGRWPEVCPVAVPPKADVCRPSGPPDGPHAEVPARRVPPAQQCATPMRHAGRRHGQLRACRRTTQGERR
jgi:hypothetical protein